MAAADDAPVSPVAAAVSPVSASTGGDDSHLDASLDSIDLLMRDHAADGNVTSGDHGHFSRMSSS